MFLCSKKYFLFLCFINFHKQRKSKELLLVSCTDYKIFIKWIFKDCTKNFLNYYDLIPGEKCIQKVFELQMILLCLTKQKSFFRWFFFLCFCVFCCYSVRFGTISQRGRKEILYWRKFFLLLLAVLSK